MRARTFLSFAALALALGGAGPACSAIIGWDSLTFDGTGTGGTGGTGGTTTIDPGCIPNQSPNPVRDDCGVFVSSSKGSDDNDGSQDKPLATIGKALATPKSGPIYLCAETFAEAVQIGGGATIYGGLDCAKGWSWIGGTTKSEISPEAGKVPLVIEPGVGVKIEDVALRAKDAVDAGGSSIAIIATAGAELDLARCDVEAGNANDGATGDAFAMSASAGATGNTGLDACTGPMIFGGGSVTNACDDPDPNDDSISGAGGIGQDSSGGDGSNGKPLGTDNRGIGEDVMACTSGGPGDPGAAGMSATGAQGTGTISAQGYAGTPGDAGEKGKPGQGGGGGGGAKGGSAANQCLSAASAGGASGGSGGSGGCGGAGGKGGQAGGASIGIVSLGAKLTFTAVKLTAKQGGKGGDGGPGQLGGTGGPGGAGGSKAGASALKDGCGGGKGGDGGPGGKGGGGLGGPSIGIAYTGDAPVTDGATIAEGKAGDGGLGDGPSGQGASGIAAPAQAFK